MTTPAQDRDQRAALSAPIAPSTSSAPREVGRAAGAELLPCPFCGSDDLEVQVSMAFGLPRVVCFSCPGTGTGHRATEAEAIAAWNRARRPETAAEATRRRSHQVRDRRRLKAARRSGGGR
jgi:hypothetical protein